MGGYNRIYYLNAVNKEINNIYKDNAKSKNEYLNFLQAELHKIDNKEDLPHREEPIKYKGELLYSIRKRTKKNTRILYFYYSSKNEIILLTAFDENNASDYDNAKRTAYNRLKNCKS